MVLTDKGPCRMDQLEPRGRIVAKFSGSVGLTHYNSARKTMTNVPVYRLTLSSGHTIVSTDTHRFLTQNGWKLLRDIEPEDKIYVWDGFYREESWARLGIDMSSGDAYGLMTAKQQLIALYAALSILQEQNSSVFAAMRVRVSIVAKSIEIAIKGCARSAEKLLMWISTKISCAALVSAECFTLEAVESIEPAGHDDVYCMNVPLFKNFVANGMVVHNSVDALRYCIYTHFFSKPEQRLTPRELDDMYNDAMGYTGF